MKISSAAFVVACALTTPFAAGCGEDPCDPGFEREGGVCVDARQKLVGSWLASDTCSASGTATYAVQIALDPATQDGVSMTNFWGFFLAPARASLSHHTLTIARQEPDFDGYYVIGSGTHGAAGEMEFSFTVTDETDPSAILTDVCTSTWTKM